MCESNLQFDEAGRALLANLPAWRLRAVERIELSSAFWSERNREIHVRPLSEVIRESPHDVGSELSKLLPARRDGIPPGKIELVLPITELSKIPLLDLKITVAGKRVARATRDEGARIQALHLLHLARELSLPIVDNSGNPPDQDLLFNFLTFLFYFPGHPYERRLKGLRSLGFPEKYCRREYLAEEGLTRQSVRQYAAIAKPLGDVASEYVLHDYLSAAESPLLGIPYFRRELKKRGLEPSEETIKSLLECVCTAVMTVHKKKKGERTKEENAFLSAYFGYGHRWMSFARCIVPLDEPFIISVKEKRAIYFHPERTLSRKPPVKSYLWPPLGQRSVWQMVAYADAETNHVSIRVADTAVRLKGEPETVDEAKGKISSGEIDEEERTFELYLRQDSQPTRPDRIYIKCGVGLTRIQSWMLGLTMAVTAFAIAVVGWRVSETLPPDVQSLFTLRSGQLVSEQGDKFGHNLTAKDATVVLVPVAFAAALLLVRDSSTLSTWLRKFRQSILMVELFALLTTAFLLYWFHLIKAG